MMNVCFPEQRKAALRKVELELDEADDIVRGLNQFFRMLLTSGLGIATRSGDTGDSAVGQASIYSASEGGKGGPHKVQEAIKGATLTGRAVGSTRVVQEWLVKLR